jgi:hypothetical protein
MMSSPISRSAALIVAMVMPVAAQDGLRSKRVRPMTGAEREGFESQSRIAVVVGVGDHSR